MTTSTMPAAATATKKLKVMVFTQPLVGGGGAERFVSNLTVALGDEIDFVLVWPEREQPDAHTLPFKGRGRGVDLGASHATRAWAARALRFGKRLAMIRRLIDEERPDVVLSNFTYIWHVLLAALRALAPRGPAVILRFGNPVSQDVVSRGAVLHLFLRATTQRADMLVANSNGLAADLRQALGVRGDRVTVINNPFPVDAIWEQAQAPVTEPPFDGTIPVVVTVGRLVTQKNQALLVRAFRTVRDRMPARLVIIGSGWNKDAVVALTHQLGLDDDVTFMGWQENPFKYLRSAALFALTSRFEGFPNALVEAMACGCAVVSTRCRFGPEEIVDHGKNGLLVPEEDPPALAAAMLRLLEDAPLRAELGAAARRRAADFDAGRVSRQYADLFSTLAARRARAHG